MPVELVELRGKPSTARHPKKVLLHAEHAPPAKPVAGTETGTWVDLRLVDEDPRNARLQFDPERLRQFAQTLKDEGQLYPVIVRKNESRYTLVDGARRFRALKLLGAARIKVDVQDLTEEQAAVKAAVANLQREDLTPFEQARALRNLLDAGVTKKEACGKAGIAFNTLEARLSLLELPPDLGQLAGHGAFSLAHAQVLLPLKGHSVTTKKGIVSLLDAAAAAIRDMMARDDVPDLWGLPGRIGDALARVGLVRQLDWSDEAHLYAKVPHVELGDDKRARKRRVYVDVAAFDARKQHLAQLRAEREAKEAAARKKSNHNAPEPAWKRENRKRALQGKETRRLMRAAVVATLKEKAAAGPGLWALVAARTAEEDEHGQVKDEADDVLDCAKLAAAAAGVDQDDVGKTFGLTLPEKPDRYAFRNEYRTLGAPPAWWSKASRDHQVIFTVAFLGALGLNTYAPAPAAVQLLTGSKPEAFEAKAKKAAEKILAAQDAARKEGKKRKGV